MFTKIFANNCLLSLVLISTTHTVIQKTLAEEALTNNQLNSSMLFERIHLAETAGSKERTLQRVKRKGIGSFFGAKSKTTPNTWENSNGQWNNVPENARFPMYGASGEVHGSGGNYFQSQENYRESSIYYLVVGSISFGIIVYCCYQFKSEARGDLDDRFAYRNAVSQQHAPFSSMNDSSPSQQIGCNNAGTHKPPSALAPSAPSFLMTDVLVDTCPNYLPKSDYPEHPPPSYEEAVVSDRKLQS